MNPQKNSPKIKRRRKELANETLGPCLLDLPEEILRHILSYVDLRSKVYVWKTCTQLRRTLSGHGRVPRATYDLLNNYNLHLEELNVSGIKGCFETEAVSALTRLRNLQSLDVTYTSVTLLGANTICAACPRLTRLSCGVSNKDKIPLTSTNLDYVHLVCNEPISWKELEDLVEAPNLKEYKFTDCEPVYKFHSDTLPWRRDRFPKLQSSSYHFKDDKNSEHPFNKGEGDIVPGAWDFVLILDSVLNFRFDTDFFEYIYDAKIILSERLRRVASSLRLELSDIFQKATLHDKILNCDFTAHLYLWRPSLTELNQNLYADLLREIDSKFLQVICNSLHSGSPVSASTRRQHQVDAENQLYYVCPCSFKMDGEEIVLDTKRKLYDLNLHASIPSDRKIQLILQNMCVDPSSYIWCNVITSSNFPVLCNIVHLSLLFDANSSPMYSYKDLFAHCVNLHTLEIRVVDKIAEILNDLQWCTSIRNLLFEVNDELYHDDEKMCLKYVCSSLMRCHSLENLVLLTKNVPMELYWNDYFSNAGEFKLVMENFFVNCAHLSSLYFDSRNEELRDVIRGILRRLRISDLKVTFGQVGGGDYNAYPHYYKIFVKDTKFASLQVNKKLILSQKKDLM